MDKCEGECLKTVNDVVGEGCKSIHDGYYCTRLEGHDDNHIACGGRCLATSAWRSHGGVMKLEFQPAFPAASQITERMGLTKREYYAGLMMQGALSGRNAWPKSEGEEKCLATACVDLADALIAELEKKK